MWIEKFQIEKKNKIAAIYPVTKIWMVLLYTLGALVLATVNVWGLPILLAPYFIVILITASISGCLKSYCKAVRKIAIFATIVFFFQAFLLPGGNTVFSLGILKISESGLQMGTRLSLTMLCAGGAFLWLFHTTKNKEISRALEQSGMNYKAAYVFLSTMQMIELLGRNSKTIMNAQQARGVETQGNVVSRAKAFMPSMIPLILGAIISSEDRALTLESKGFDVQCTKTHILDIKKSGCENAAMVVTVLILLITIGIRGAAWVL